MKPTTSGKALISYVFWKNVNHNKVLYYGTVIYYILRYKSIRDAIRLKFACDRVESQDAWRVEYAKIMAPLIEVQNMITDLTKLLKTTQNGNFK